MMPFMECWHSLVSIAHEGRARSRSTAGRVVFDAGQGYIEANPAAPSESHL
jgi:hypothetical protein